MAAFNVAANPVVLGKLAPTSGTPIRLTANLTAAYGNTEIADDLHAHTLEIVASTDNAGRLYVGYTGLNKTTLAGVIKVLEPGESWSISGPSMNTYWVGTYFVDVATSTDYCNGFAHVV